MRSITIFLGIFLLSSMALADVPFPYQAQIKVNRKPAPDTISFNDSARKAAADIFEKFNQQCVENPGASDIAVVTDVAPGDDGEFSKASSEVLLLKTYIANLGFPEKMIFTTVIRRGTGVQPISPNIVVELSCRRKAVK